MRLNRPLAPGRESAIYRSSKRTWCQCLTFICCWWGGMAARISLRWAAQWVGRYSIILTVSTTQLSSTLHVDHDQSAVLSFLRKSNSFLWVGFSLSKGPNTFSKAWKRLRITWRSRWVGTCANPSKSSTRTSTYANNWTLVRRRRGYRYKGTRVGSNVVAKALTTAADLLSILCGRKGACAQRAWFAKSSTVCVAVQNRVGEFFHLVGRVRGVSVSGSSL